MLVLYVLGGKLEQIHGSAIAGFIFIVVGLKASMACNLVDAALGGIVGAMGTPFGITRATCADSWTIWNLITLLEHSRGVDFLTFATF